MATVSMASLPGRVRSFAGFCHSAWQSDFVQKVTGTVATRFLLIAVSLVASVLVARVLGPEKKGLYAAATTLAAMGVQFGNLGLQASNTYTVARDRQLLPAVVANSLFASFGVGGVVALVAWLILDASPSLAPVRGPILTLSLFFFPLSLASLLLQNILIGLQQIREYNYLEIFSNLSFVIVILALILFDIITVSSILTTNIIVTVFIIFINYIILKKFINKDLRVSLGTLKRSVAYGTKAYLSSLFAFLVLRVDLLVVKYILGSTATGFYSIAASMADIIYLIPVVIGTILFPKLCASNDDRERLAMAKKAVLAVSLIMSIPLILSVAIARPVVSLLYGPVFLPVVPAFLFLLPGIYLLSIQTVAVQYLNSVGFPISVVLVWAGATILNLATNFIFIPKLGIVGASISSTFSYTFICFAIFFLIYRHTRMSCS